MENFTSQKKAEALKERIHEAAVVLGALRNSEHRNISGASEVLDVVDRLLSDAWTIADGLDPAGSQWIGDKPAQTSLADGEEEYYHADLVDQISAGFSAVYDLLKRIEKEEDVEGAITLASMAQILYKNALKRKDMIVGELEKQTGPIEVLVDTNKGHTDYDLPVKGIVIRRKQEAGHEPI